MRLSQFIITILSVTFLFTCIMFFNADVFNATRNVSDEYKNYLTTSSISAIEQADVDDNEVFKTKEQREDAINRFFDTLKLCFNIKGTITESAQVEEVVPCVALVDNDGMYVNYRTTYNDATGAPARTRATSPLCTWGKKYGNYFIRFYLDDTVDIIASDFPKKEYSGNNKDVYNLIVEDYSKRLLFENPAVHLAFLNDSNLFKTEKSLVIISQANKTINYYLNECNNTFRNVNDTKYDYRMPQISDTEYSRLLTGPTVISFMQGNQITRFPGYLNIYALAGSEKTVGKTYTITTEDVNGVNYNFYHAAGCIKSTRNTKTYSSMQECAKKGAYPCPYCIH